MRFEAIALQFRNPSEHDLFAIMKLYQMSYPLSSVDSAFTDYYSLQESLDSPKFYWLLAEKDGVLVGLVSAALEPEHRLAKLHRVYVNPSVPLGKNIHEILLGEMTRRLVQDLKIEMIYCTTRTFTRLQHEATLNIGYKMVGVFPNALGVDHTRINGITAYYADSVLESMRYRFSTLHPRLKGLYDLVQQSCALPSVEVKRVEGSINFGAEREAYLEIIHAPRFIAQKYKTLKERKNLSNPFYPFVVPNALALSPDETIQVFLLMRPEIRFATVVAERYDSPIHPTRMYRKIVETLHQQGITYIEILNDAADYWGVECIINAGFLPCAYVPAFKSHGDFRRDYVVFGLTLEKNIQNVVVPQSQIHPLYRAFLNEYERLEREGAVYD